MTRLPLTLALLGFCGGLAACTTPLDAPLSANFGQAVASMQSQIIPAAVSDAPPETSGARASLAVRRYEQDKVKQPAVSATSTLAVGPDAGGGSDSEVTK